MDRNPNGNEGERETQKLYSESANCSVPDLGSRMASVAPHYRHLVSSGHVTSAPVQHNDLVFHLWPVETQTMDVHSYVLFWHSGGNSGCHYP